MTVSQPSRSVVIPARLRSSRLPRKMLADLNGAPLIERTWQVAVEAACGPVVVLADDDEVAQIVRGFGGEVIMTDPALESGTARVASVADRLDAEIVVNLQGDAPLTDPEVVNRAADEAAKSDAAVTLPVYRISDAAEVHDPSVVKVVLSRGGRVLYCSRSPVPHVRDAELESWVERTRFLGHVGIYAYRRAFLAGFDALSVSALEDAERLEQLRWLEDGMELRAFEVDPQGPSVDTAAQLDRVRALHHARVGAQGR